MYENYKDSDAEGKKLSSWSFPEMPEDDLLYDSNRKSQCDFIQTMQEEAESLLDAYMSVLVNGSPSPRELMNVIDIAMRYFAYNGIEIKRELNMAIQENKYGSATIVSPTKKLYVHLTMLIHCYSAHKAAFDSVDVEKILNDARTVIQNRFNTLESLTPNEESNFTCSIKGVLYDYLRLKHERRTKKSFFGRLASGQTIKIVDRTFKFCDENGKLVEESDKDYENETPFFETYKLAERCFDGFLMAYEANYDKLIGIDSAINDSELFSFEKLNAFIEDLAWRLDGLYDKLSESTIKGELTERERSEFGSMPKLFDDAMLEEIYQEVNGKQFQEIPFEYFSNSVNAPARPTHLEVLPNQIKKACFLISRLACCLPHEKRDSWTKAMTESVGIKESTYKAKRRSCVDSNSTETDREYVEKLNSIAKKHNAPIE